MTTIVSELSAAAAARDTASQNTYDRLCRQLADGENLQPDAVLTILDRVGKSAGDLERDVVKLTEQDRKELAAAEQQEREAANALAQHDRAVAARMEPLETEAAKLESELSAVRNEMESLEAENRPVRQGLYGDWSAASQRVGHLRNRLAVTAQRGLEAKRRASLAYQSAESQFRAAQQSVSESWQYLSETKAKLASLQQRAAWAKNEYDVAVKAINAGYGNAGDGGLCGANVPLTSMPTDGSKKLDKPIADLTQQVEQAEAQYAAAGRREQQARETLAKIDAQLAQAA